MYKLIIGIPSFNEEETIKSVVEIIDEGLSKLNLKSKIVLIDSNSYDNTVKFFNETKTNNDKESFILTGERGKGKNILFALNKFKNVDYIMFFDADLKSINSDWIKKYYDYLKEGYDYILPYYLRNKFEGSATNHLVYPLLHYVTKKHFRQPIGGDFGLSNKFINFILNKYYHNDTLKYGIDIYLTYMAIFGGMKIVSINLGYKLHKPSFGNLAYMFPHIFNSFIYVYRKYPIENNNILYQNFLEKIDFNDNISKFPHKDKIGEMKNESLQILELLKSDTKNFFDKYKKEGFTFNLWKDILTYYLDNYDYSDKQTNEILSFYKLRVISFWEEIENINSKETEKLIVSQASIF